MSDTVERLLRATSDLLTAHMDAELAFTAWNERDAELKEIERAYRVQIANKIGPDGKALYSNDTKREAALHEVMQRSHRAMLDARTDAEQGKRATAAEYERLHEEVRTLRVVVAHETATLELQAVEIETAAMPRLMTGTRYQR